MQSGRRGRAVLAGETGIQLKCGSPGTYQVLIVMNSSDPTRIAPAQLGDFTCIHP